MIPRQTRKRLPRAKLLTVRRVQGRRFLAKFRNANAWTLYLWWFEVTIRAPWLERSARQLHPHLF